VNGTAPANPLVSDLPKRHLPTRKMWLEEILLGVCSDVLLPRAVNRSKDPWPILQAMDVLQRDLAALTSRLLT
jgi:hypothetical protein